MENSIDIDLLLEFLGGAVEITTAKPGFSAFPLLGKPWELVSSSVAQLSRQSRKLPGAHLQLIEGQIYAEITLPYTVSKPSCFLCVHLRGTSRLYDQQGFPLRGLDLPYLSLGYYPACAYVIQLSPGLHSFGVVSFEDAWPFDHRSSYPAFSALIDPWLSAAEQVYRLAPTPISRTITGLLEDIRFTAVSNMQDSVRILHLLGKVIQTYHEQLEADAANMGRSPEQLLQQLDSYLEKHYMNKQLCDLSLIKKELGLSRMLLEKLSKESMGCTLRRYLVEFRINKACVLLLETNDKIREIAYRTGFPDLANFTNRFKAVMGVHPSVYRRKHS